MALATIPLILQVATQVQQLGVNWYKASDEWSSFPEQINDLKTTCDMWNEKLTKFGKLSDGLLVKRLHTAESLLNEERAKLEKRGPNADQKCFAGCWPKLYMTAFPASLGQAIQGVTEAFNKIITDMQLEGQIEAGLRDGLLHGAAPLDIAHDSRYVPLKVSEQLIREQFDNPDGYRVVFLHGGPGTGKSTLARYIAWCYFKGDKAQFRHVVFLECGPKVDKTAIPRMELELLQKVDYAIAPSEVKEEPGSDLEIRKLLQELLRDQSILIVFDDVFDAEFLQKMVLLCGSRVRCLVTCQDKDLWKKLPNSCSFRIQGLKPEDARKILACHTRLPGDEIPDHLLETANKIIKVADNNPLALASLATAIDDDRVLELSDWEDALANSNKYLHSADPELIHGMKRGHSYWSALKQSYDSLKDEGACKLLILLSLCEGSSAPEEVFRVIYESTKFKGILGTYGESTTFVRSRNRLVSWEWITITDSGVGVLRKTTWSMHSLQRNFVLEQMKNDTESVLTSLFNVREGKKKKKGKKMTESNVKNQVANHQNEEEKILSSVCALYFDREYAVKMGKPFERFDDLRKNAIEPIILLLGLQSTGEWKQINQTTASKVFLSYISRGVLDHDGLSQLLDVEVSSLATLRALRDIAAVEKKSILDGAKDGFKESVMNVVVRYLVTDGDKSIQVEALRTLGDLCSKRGHEAFIVSFPGVSESVVRLLEKHSQKSLANLVMRGEEMSAPSTRHEGAPIVMSSSEHESIALLEQAARALVDLLSVERPGPQEAGR